MAAVLIVGGLTAVGHGMCRRQRRRCLETARHVLLLMSLEILATIVHCSGSGRG